MESLQISDQKYNLRWPDYHNSVLSSFRFEPFIESFTQQFLWCTYPGWRIPNLSVILTYSPPNRFISTFHSLFLMRRREQRRNVFQYAEERREEIVCVINKEFLSFRSLKEEEDFIDVTLSCEERQYSAHKVVLSACSPYFRKLLKVKSACANHRLKNYSLLTKVLLLAKPQSFLDILLFFPPGNLKLAIKYTSRRLLITDKHLKYFAAF